MRSRKFLPAVVLALFCTTAASAQDWARKMFDATEHDFGMVARGSKTVHHFTITNIYEEDVHIAAVRSSCGCTTPTVTQRTLKTYETSEILADFNTRSFLGDKSATITVTFDKPFYAEVQLRVKGYIRSDVVLHPPAVELGSVDRGTPVERRIAIEYAGRNDWEILDIRSPCPYLDTELIERKRGNGQVGYDLVVRLQEDAPVGYIKGQMLLVTNDRRASTVPLDVEGQVKSEITVSPSSLFMGVVQPGQKVTKQLVVRSAKPFRIVSVDCDDDCFEFKTSDAAKALHLIPVTFVAGAEPGKVVHRIRIETDLGEDVSELQAYAQISPAAN